MDLTTQTPAQIDTALAKDQHLLAMAEQGIEISTKEIERIEAAQSVHERAYPWNSLAKRDEHAQAIDGYREIIATLLPRIAAANAEFRRRGGWTRFYLVTNTNGHVHTSTHCDTCFPTTEFVWLTEQSGMTHAEVVNLAGEATCLVCFPDPDRSALRKKSRLEDPAKRASREEREAKRDAALEKKIANGLTADGSDLRVKYTTTYTHGGTFASSESFKTERAATIWLVDAIVDSIPRERAENDSHYVVENTGIPVVMAALAAKHGMMTLEEVDEMLAPKILRKKKSIAKTLKDWGMEVPAYLGL